MKRVLVTGAGRGLGLEFIRQCLARGDRVFGGVRRTPLPPAVRELRERYPDRLSVLDLEVTDAKAIAQAKDTVERQAQALDLLLNNAGMDQRSPEAGDPDGHKQLGRLDPETMLRVFRVNTIAPLMVAQQFLPLLQAGDKPRIVNISSVLGSLARKTEGSYYSYSASKAGLNMLTRALAADALRDGIVAVVLHPGWVRTDLGGPSAPLAPEESVRGMLQVIERLTARDAGRFLDWTGQEVPW